MATIRDLAELSSEVYGNFSLQDTKAAQQYLLQNGWKRLITSAQDFTPKSRSYYAEAWRSPSGEIVITNRGTRGFTSSSDLMNDAELGFGQVTNDELDAQTFAQDVKLAYDPYGSIPIVETGHSLGGNEAQAGVIALVNAGMPTANVSAITFNAPGIGGYLANNLHNNPSSYRVLNLYNQGDWIHEAGGQHLGTTVASSLAAGPTIGDEIFDGLRAMGLGLRFNALAGVATGVAALGKDIIVKAHSINTTIAYLQANPGIGSQTYQTYVSQQLGSSGGTVALNDSSGAYTMTDGQGDTFTLTPGSNGGMTASATLGAQGGSTGLANPSAVNPELASAGTVSLTAGDLRQDVSAFLSATNLTGTVDNMSTRSTTNIPGFGFNSSGSGLVEPIQANTQGRYDYNPPATGTAVETILANSGNGSVWVNNTSLAGGTAASGATDTWTDSHGDQYQFAPLGAGSNIGTLTITQGLLGGPGNEIDINNFDFNAAQTNPTGYLGIVFAEQTALVAGSNANPFSDGYVVPSNSSVGNIQQGTLPLTVYVSAASSTAQTVTITMTQGDPSGFSIDTGQECVAFGSGTATLTIPAGQNSLSFGLVNDTDVTQPETVQLTATLTGNGSTATNNLTIGYVPQPNDPAQLPPSTITNQIAGTVQGGVTYYRGDGQNDLIVTDNTPSYVTASSGNDVINLGNGSDTVDPGTGNDTIYGGTGTDVIKWIKGNDLIIGNGGQDVIEATYTNGTSNNRIFAGTMTDLATAIAQAGTEAPSGQKGDFIVASTGVDTIVGGPGNDVYADAGGNNVIVCGPGNNIVEQDMGFGNVADDSGRWAA